MITKLKDEMSYISPPGDTLIDLLKSIKMSQAELARRTGRPVKTINEIVKGKTAITTKTALQFEKVLKVSAHFWNNREKQYQEALSAQQEQQAMVTNLQWLSRFPVRDLVKNGWIKAYSDKIKQLIEVLQFFSIASPTQWKSIWNSSQVVFRKSNVYRSNPTALSAWLRQGEIQAEKINCSTYDKLSFINSLKKLRLLSNEMPDQFIPKVQSICSKSGVAVVFVPEISGTCTCGASRWLNSNKALIQLSARYKTNDHLWFTFFHEAGHLVYGKKRMFNLENVNSSRQSRNALEKKVDTFAQDILIPLKSYKSFIENADFSESAIKQFSTSINIAIGIVVGRLQHDKYMSFGTSMNRYKILFKWT